MKHFSYPTPRTAVLDLMQRFLDASPGMIDTWFATTSVSCNNAIEITAPVPLDLDFGEFFMAPSRWKVFCDQYLGADFEQWLDRTVKRPKTSESGYVFHPVKVHSNGNCVVSMSTHLSPHPQVTLNSRASRIMPTGVLELSLASLVAKRLQEAAPKAGPATVVWNVTQLQFSALWGFAYLYHNQFGTEAKPILQRSHMSNYVRMVKGMKEYNEGYRFAFQRKNRIIKNTLKDYAPFIPVGVLGGKTNGHQAGFEDLPGWEDPMSPLELIETAMMMDEDDMTAPIGIPQEV